MKGCTCRNSHSKEHRREVAKCSNGHEGKALAKGGPGEEEGEDEAASKARQHREADGEQLGEAYQHEQPPSVFSLQFQSQC